MDNNQSKFSAINALSGGIDKIGDVQYNKPKADEGNKKSSVMDLINPNLNPDKHLEAKAAVYNKDEMKYTDTELKNVVDEGIKKEGAMAVDIMVRQGEAIENALRRNNIHALKLPNGHEYQVKIMTASIDTNPVTRDELLDQILQEIKTHYPVFLVTDADLGLKKSDDPPVEKTDNAKPVEHQPILNRSGDVTNKIYENPVQEDSIETPNKSIEKEREEISKTLQNKDVVISSEDIEANTELPADTSVRHVNIKIVEDVNLRYNNIKTNTKPDISKIITRVRTSKARDVIGALPSSKYRATFSGLSFTEVWELDHSEKMNDLESLKRKWSIAYLHTHNPSIGEFKDFDDFLKKTSYMDIEYILWNIQNATSKPVEVVSYKCPEILEDGSECGHEFRWSYRPRETMDIQSMNKEVLNDMTLVVDAIGLEESIRLYNTSAVSNNNVVELPSSTLGMIYGHISAYDYIHKVFPKINKAKDNMNVRLAFKIAALYMVKGFYVPTDDGETVLITDVDEIFDILDALDEIDWTVINTMYTKINDPYIIRFRIPNIQCKKCNRVRDEEIEDLSRMLFITAQNLMSVTVDLN